LLKHIKRFVCSFPTSTRVNPTYFNFVTVVTTDSHPEANSTWSHFCEVGELASYGHWVSKGE
jgi:hypothetical protein